MNNEGTAGAPVSDRPKIWSCKIGEVDASVLPRNAERAMRDAVEQAYREQTGGSPEFTFSGWGAELTEGERAVVEDREPEFLRTGFLEEEVNQLRIKLRDGDAMPGWDELAWLALLMHQVGQLAYIWHPEDRTPAPAGEIELLKTIACIALDAIEDLGARWAAQEKAA